MSGTRIYLKKSKIFNVFVAVIVPLVMLLSFMGSSVLAAADTVIVNEPSVVVVPFYDNAIDSTNRAEFTAYIIGDYDSFRWQYTNDGQYWHDSDYDSLTIHPYVGGLAQSLDYRILVYYNNSSDFVISNSVTVYNSNIIDMPLDVEIQDFTSWSSILLQRFLEWFNILLSWMLDNPIVFVFLALAIIISSIGTMRHLIGGVYAKQKEKNKEKDLY